MHSSSGDILKSQAQTMCGWVEAAETRCHNFSNLVHRNRPHLQIVELFELLPLSRWPVATVTEACGVRATALVPVFLLQPSHCMGKEVQLENENHFDFAGVR